MTAQIYLGNSPSIIDFFFKGDITEKLLNFIRKGVFIMKENLHGKIRKR